MATIFDFRISCTPALRRLADRVLTEAHATVTKLEQELTEFLPESPVFKLNSSAPGTRIEFTPSGIELIERAFIIRRKSEGAFDPLSKSTTQSGEEAGISWDAVTRQVWKLTEGTRLGFGAIGKGYALDQVKSRIELAGFENYVLSAGGSSVVLSGQESPSNPWKWGWSWKKDEAGHDLGIGFVHESGKKIALGISGTHEKGAHILDARNRNDARNENAAPMRLRSALIGTPSATDADALSTALFVSGWDQSKTFLSQLPLPPAAACIDHEEVPHWNGLFQHFWKGLATCLALAISSKAFGADDGAIDLSTMGDAASSFTPYVFERSSLWVLLPIFTFLVVLSHLRKTKPIRKGQNGKNLMKKHIKLTSLVVAGITWLSVENVRAVEIEPAGKAVQALLGTPKAFQKQLKGPDGNVVTFYSKNAAGKADKIVFIQKGIYQPDCTHTWAVGLDVATNKVTSVRVIEMGCPHAYPTKSASFMDQFKGKGPADVAKLDSEIQTVAKATGTSQLATQAVKKSITTLAKYKGQL